jgi:iron complex outermembrane recepter protein
VSNQETKVQQEKVTAYEAGVKYASRRLDASLAGFYYDYLNKQVFADSPVPLLGPVSILSNIPKSKAYGLDAEASVRPIAGLTLHDGFGRPIDYRGHPFPYAPKISGVFDAEYRWALSAVMDGFIGINGSYQGQQSGDLSTEPNFNIPGYALFDARGGVEISRSTTITLWMRNIANRYYWTDTNFGGEGYFRTAGFPRDVGITASYRF